MNLEDKSNTFSPISQGVNSETCVKFMKMAHVAVTEGVNNSRKKFVQDPMDFDYRCAKSVWMNSQIKKHFKLLFSYDNFLKGKVRHLKSHGVDYYVIEGKILVCFKKMDLKSRVSGFYSKRFKDILLGNKVHYSKSMLDNLAAMGISKPLPIYYVGHVLDSIGRLVDVRIVHYNNMSVAYEESLTDMFTTNLFTLGANTTDVKQIDVEVKSKGKGKNPGESQKTS